MDDALKAEFSTVCAEIGMSASTAVNIFAKKVVREQRIPFELSSRPDGAAALEREVRAYERGLAAALTEGYMDAEAGRTHTLEELRTARQHAAEGAPHAQ